MRVFGRWGGRQSSLDCSPWLLLLQRWIVESRKSAG